MREPGESSLASIDLLSGLSPAERREVEKACSWKRFITRQQVIDRNSQSRGVYMIVEGRVRVVNYALSGREVTFDELPEGSFFGELAAIDGRPRSARVIALTNSLIAALPGSKFLEILENHSSIALKVLVQLASVVRASNERIMDLSTLGANNRVHAELLRQTHENMGGDNRAVIKPNPLHGDIASRVSTTRETVARVMNNLARRAIVKRTKEALIVIDIEKLRAMVQEVRGE
ncbi:MAG: Crp/Fnr family transcriptional regulator [Rhodospirillales bacterium]|nr:Crp/Fnr family transcriptional regulator [Rhodospirillales bacterium]MDP7241308.1 Crp/Fnr family transcriptional regulator [Rhodospirillales bacterium]